MPCCNPSGEPQLNVASGLDSLLQSLGGAGKGPSASRHTTFPSSLLSSAFCCHLARILGLATLLWGCSAWMLTGSHTWAPRSRLGDLSPAQTVGRPQQRPPSDAGWVGKDVPSPREGTYSQGPSSLRTITHIQPGDPASALCSTKPRGMPGRLVTDSDLDAFSQYPSHGSFATLVARPIAETRGVA